MTEKKRRRVRLKTSNHSDEHIRKMHQARRDKKAKKSRPHFRELMENYEQAEGPPEGTPVPWGKPPEFIRDPTIAKRIYKYMSEGLPYTTVCRLVGLKSATVREWLQKGSEGAYWYVDFYNKFCKAEALGERNTLKKLEKHESNDWRASAWKLERRWPAHWGKQDRTRAEIQVNGELSVTHKDELSRRVVDDETTRELARRLIDGKEFGYSVNEVEDLSEEVE